MGKNGHPEEDREENLVGKKNNESWECNPVI